MSFNSEIEKNIKDLKYIFIGNFITEGVSAACQFCIFDQFKNLEDTLTLKELSNHVSANYSSLKKLLNFLVALDLLCILPDKETYKLTSKGSLLRKDNTPSLYYYCLLHSTDLFKKSADFLFKSIKQDKPANYYFCEEGPYSFLEKKETDRTIFNKAMSSLAKIYAKDISDFVESLKPKTILDAGGGIGALLCTILKSNPHVSGTILDLPSLKIEALSYIKKCRLSKRAFFVGKSFFESFQLNVDVIILNNILYDYDDKNCTAILRECKKSLNNNGSILVIENVLSKTSELNDIKNLFMHAITFGGRTRNQQDFQTIFDKSGLKIKQIINLGLSSDVSIMRLSE